MSTLNNVGGGGKMIIKSRDQVSEGKMLLTAEIMRGSFLKKYQ